MRKILHLSEVATLINVPLATLRRWRHNGDGPPTWKLGSRVVAYEDEVLQWLDLQRAKGA